MLPYPTGLIRAHALHSGLPVRRRRLSLLATVVAIVSTAAVVAAVAIWAGRDLNPKAGSGSPGVSLASLVTRSARNTLAQQTADISVQGAVDVGSSEVNLRGDGQADFAANTWDMDMSWSAAGTTVTENEIAAKQALYFQLIVDGRIAQYFDGRDWFESPIAVSASQVAPQHSPVWSLQLLEQQGAQVVPMGSQRVGGLVCDQYVVTPTKRAMLAAAQHEWTELGLSGSEEAAGRQLLANSSTPTFTIWLEPKRQLACQLDVYLQIGMESPEGSASAPATDTVQLLMTFSHYSVPVTITPPAESDTISL